ncbi:MAG: hypothetical protein KTR16_02665 [Acidiferrobacterales bacterium]|nr:hypothetical protein [Acidiferrobacterales bacterium]
MNSSAAVIEHVSPPNGRRELTYVALAAIGLIATQLLYVSTLGRDEIDEPLHAWQISSFNSFEGPDQAIYNSLYTVKEEITYIYDDVNRFNEPGVKFRWPNLADFQDYLLPPFYQDSSWVQNGEVEWTLFEPLPEGEMQGYSMYLGTNGKKPNQGSFLLTISHVHAGMENNNSTEIWWHKDQQIEMPISGFKDTLIKLGWQYVVPHSGDKELLRIYGEEMYGE